MNKYNKQAINKTKTHIETNASLESAKCWRAKA